MLQLAIRAKLGRVRLRLVHRSLAFSRQLRRMGGACFSLPSERSSDAQGSALPPGAWPFPGSSAAWVGHASACHPSEAPTRKAPRCPPELGLFPAAPPHGWGMLQLAIRAKLRRVRLRVAPRSLAFSRQLRRMGGACFSLPSERSSDA